MTAAERLKQLSGLAGASAAAMLLAIGAGSTSAEILLSESTLTGGTAAQVLLAERRAAPAPIEPAVREPLSTPGVFEDAGAGRVWKDHAWVKATKFAKIGISKQCSGAASASVSVSACTRSMGIRFGAGEASVRVESFAKPRHVNVTCDSGLYVANSSVSATCTSLISTSYNGTCEALSADEIIAIFEVLQDE